MAGGAAPWLMPGAGVEQAQLVLRTVEAVILFGTASLGLLSGRWAARTSAGFACTALLVLGFAGAASATSLGGTGFGPMMTAGGAVFAVVLLLGAAAAPEVTDVASFRRLLTRDSGPIALVENGDWIVLDANVNTIEVQVDAAVLEARRAQWLPPAPNVERGVLRKYIRTVGNASNGCLTDS